MKIPDAVKSAHKQMFDCAVEECVTLFITGVLRMQVPPVMEWEEYIDICKDVDEEVIVGARLTWVDSQVPIPICVLKLTEEPEWSYRVVVE